MLSDHKKPDCYTDNQWEIDIVTADGVVVPRVHPCLYCTPDHRSEMLSVGLCSNPEIKFYKVDFFEKFEGVDYLLMDVVCAPTGGAPDVSDLDEVLGVEQHGQN